MGRRGPPKTPTPILKLHGSHRAKSREGKEPKPATLRPRSQITLTAREKKVYTQVCDWLKSMNLQAATDGNAIGRYAKNVCRYNDCSDYLEKHGETFPIFGRHADGTKKLNGVKRFPQSILRNEIEVAMWRAERDLGLTPAARASLQVDKPTVNSDLEARYFG